MKYKMKYRKNKPPKIIHKCDMVFEKRTTFDLGRFVPRPLEFFQFKCKDCGRKGAVPVREFLASTRPAKPAVIR